MKAPQFRWQPPAQCDCTLKGSRVEGEGRQEVRDCPFHCLTALIRARMARRVRGHGGSSTPWVGEEAPPGTGGVDILASRCTSTRVHCRWSAR